MQHLAWGHRRRRVRLAHCRGRPARRGRPAWRGRRRLLLIILYYYYINYIII